MRSLLADLRFTRGPWLAAFVAALITAGALSVVVGIEAPAGAVTGATVTLTNFDGTATGRANQVVRLDSTGASLDAEEGGISAFTDPATNAPAYFLYGESHACGFAWTVTSEPYCGVNVYSSTDLNHWVNRGTVNGKAFDQTTSDFSACPGSCFRPHVVYVPGNVAAMRYVMWVNRPGAEYIVLTASSPAGPFTVKSHIVGGTQVQTNPPGGVTDENLFVDPVTNQGYLAYTFYTNVAPQTRSTLAIRPLDSTMTQLKTGGSSTILYVGPTSGDLVNNGVEAPAMFERPNAAGTPIYYLTYSDPNCGYGTRCGTSYQWSLSPTGPFGPGPVNTANPPQPVAQSPGEDYFAVRAGTQISPDSCGGQPTDVAQLQLSSGGVVYLYQSMLNTGLLNEGQANFYWAPLSFDAGANINPIGSATGAPGWAACPASATLSLANAVTANDPAIAGVDQSSMGGKFAFGPCNIGGATGQSSVLQTFTAGKLGSLTSVALSVYSRWAPGSGSAPPSPPTALSAALYALDASGVPTGGALGSGSLQPTALSPSVTPGSIGWSASTLTVPMSVPLVAGTRYGIVVSSSSQVSNQYGTACYGLLTSVGANPLTGGASFTRANGSATWTPSLSPSGAPSSIRFYTTVTPAAALVNKQLGTCVGLTNPVSGTGALDVTCSSSIATLSSKAGSTPNTLTFTTGSLCIDIAFESTAVGASVVSGNCSGHASQNWTVQSNGDGTYTFVNGNSNMCMDVASHTNANGTPIVQGPCSGSTYQKWIAAPAPVQVEIANATPTDQVCAAIASPGSGTPVSTAECGASAVQYSVATQTSVGSNGQQQLKFVLPGGQLCLDTQNGGTTNGTAVVSATCGSQSASQLWTPQYNSDGSVTLINAKSGRCMDIDNHNPGTGILVTIGDCSSSTFQNWRLSAAP